MDQKGKVNNLFSIIGDNFTRNDKIIVNQYKRLNNNYITLFLTKIY